MIDGLKKDEKNNLIKKINLKNLDKSALLKIIYCYQECYDKIIINEILNFYEKEEDAFKKELIQIKLDSIYSDIKKTKFIKKENFINHSVYYYNNCTNIYFKKNLSIENIKEILTNIKSKKITLIIKKKNSINRYLINNNMELLEKKLINYDDFYITYE